MLEYKPLLILAGVRESMATILPKRYDLKINLEYFYDALEFLQTIQPVLHELRRIRNLISEDAWEMYELHEITDLREQMMLKAQSKVVCDLWRKRPILLQRKTINVEKISKPSEDEEPSLEAGPEDSGNDPCTQ